MLPARPCRAWAAPSFSISLRAIGYMAPFFCGRRWRSRVVYPGRIPFHGDDFTPCCVLPAPFCGHSTTVPVMTAGFTSPARTAAVSMAGSKK
jgi:hypothetical protein